MLLFPKTMAMVRIVGGINNGLQNHKTKEKTMVQESSKSYRYEKMCEAIINRIHKIADKKAEDIRFESGFKNEIIEEEEIDVQAYEYACKEFMKFIEGLAGQDELYWLVEIILEDAFDYTPSQRNPFAVRKISAEKSKVINPYKMMMTFMQ